MANNQFLLAPFSIPVSPQLPCGFFAKLFSMRFPYHLEAWNRLWKAGWKKPDVSKVLETYVKLHVHFFSNISNYRRQRSTLEMSRFSPNLFHLYFDNKKIFPLLNFIRLKAPGINPYCWWRETSRWWWAILRGKCFLHRLTVPYISGYLPTVT